MDKRQDLIVALVLLAAGVGYFWASAVTIDQVTTYEPLGAAFIPRLMAVVMMAAGSWLVSQRLRKWKREKGNIVESYAESDEPGHPVFARRPLILAGLLIVYAATWDILGYLAATAAVTILGLLLLGSRNLKRVFVLSFIYAALLYLFFAVAMSVHSLTMLPSWMR